MVSLYSDAGGLLTLTILVPAFHVMHLQIQYLINLDSVLHSDSSWNANLRSFSVGLGDNDFTWEGKISCVLFSCWWKHLFLISFEYSTFNFSDPSSVPMRQGTSNFCTFNFSFFFTAVFQSSNSSLSRWLLPCCNHFWYLVLNSIWFCSVPLN